MFDFAGTNIRLNLHPEEVNHFSQNPFMHSFNYQCFDTPAFRIHQFEGYIEQIFIAEYPDKILLLDGCCKPDVGLIEKFIIMKLHRRMSDIKLSVVTHPHPDHGGGAPLLRKKYGIPIASYYLNDCWYAGFKGSLQHAFDIFMGWYVVLKTSHHYRSMWHKKLIRADYLLQDGEGLPGFEDWKLIHTPGHTNVDCLVYNSVEKMLYVVDMLIHLPRGFVLPFPITRPDYMEQSLRKVARLDVKTILMAHGGHCNKDVGPDMFLRMIPHVNPKLTVLLKIFKWFTSFSPMLNEDGKPYLKCREILEKSMKSRE